MSSDYALFVIFLPNDLTNEISSPSIISPKIEKAQSIDVSSLDQIRANVTHQSLNTMSSTIGQSKQNSMQSLCMILKEYFSTKNHIKTVWKLSADKKIYEVKFYAEFGFISDCIVRDLMKFGIGRSKDTIIIALPTAFIIEGQIKDKNELISKLSLAENVVEKELSMKNFDSQTVEPKSNDLNIFPKTSKLNKESDFKKSVRARLMVHQVVASIRAATTLTFDFVLLLCLASMLAAFGLLDDSSVIIVASMLVSPLMNPILGIVFGLSIREHSLWKRGFRNELIGLIICLACGFILGLLTTFSETKWGHSTSFPTSEMKTRGDVKRLWVGVLIALPSGAGVALSVLGGNTGSLVGVAISASLLPPAVNSGLLFAYSLLASLVSSIAVIDSQSNNNTVNQHHSNLQCAKYVNNDYQPLYTCNLAKEAAILAGSSLLLTVVNIICIIIMALLILRIKEVVPLHQPNEDVTNFFHYDVKMVRDYNKTIHENDLESNHSANSTLHRSHLARSIVNRWRTFKALNFPTNQDIEQTHTTNNEIQLTDLDIDQRRNLLSLKMFSKEYGLNPLNKDDYHLLTSESREKVRLLINDLLDMYEEVPPVFIGLLNFEPYATRSTAVDERMPFYEEFIRLLPPKWYQVFLFEQQKRQMKTWKLSSINRTYSLHTPKHVRHRQFTQEFSENNYHSLSHQSNRTNKRRNLQRQTSISVDEGTENEIPIEDTRFHIARLPTTSETSENKLQDD